MSDQRKAFIDNLILIAILLFCIGALQALAPAS